MSSEKWKLNSCWYDMTWSIVACQYLYGCCSPPSNLSCKQMLSRSCRGSHSIFCQSLDRLEHSLHCGQDGCLVHPLPSWCSSKVLHQTRPSPHGFLSLSDLPAREGLHPVLLRTDAPLQSGWRPNGPSDSLLVNIYMSQIFLTSNLFLHTFILCILPGFLLSKVLVTIPIKCRPSRWTICYWRLRKFQKDEKEWIGMFAASIWTWPDNTCLELIDSFKPGPLRNGAQKKLWFGFGWRACSQSTMSISFFVKWYISISVLMHFTSYFWEMRYKVMVKCVLMHFAA